MAETSRPAAPRGKAVQRKGATRHGSRRVPDWPAIGARLMQGLRVSSVLAVLATALFFGARGLEKWLDKPVASVSIEGKFQRVSRQRVADRVYAAIDASFMRLDLRRIQERLQAEPWVDQVSVQRRWPDSLHITVFEHNPIARWGASGALNQRGEIIRLQGGDDERASLADLPLLVGEPGTEQLLMARYQAINNLLKRDNLAVSQLSCDASRSWSLRLRGGVEVAVGRDQLMQRMGRFLTIYEKHLRSRWQELERVDLRYFNGLAVQWQRAQQEPVRS